MINIRKLAAIDMAWLGTRVIVTEYAVGVILPLALGLLSVRAALHDGSIMGWEGALGVWLVCIGLNYVPLLVYSALIARAGTAKEEGQPEFVRARRYGVQQVIILVPLLVDVLAIIQELSQKRRAGKTD